VAFDIRRDYDMMVHMLVVHLDSEMMVHMLHVYLPLAVVFDTKRYNM
jgi:hypothetical protein